VPILAGFTARLAIPWDPFAEDGEVHGLTSDGVFHHPSSKPSAGDDIHGLTTIWPSSFSISKLLERCKDELVAGAEVLELGGGASCLAASSCARLGAMSVLTTDGNRVATRNLVSNRGAGVDTSGKALPADIAAARKRNGGQNFGLIVAAYCLYSPFALPDFVETVSELLKAEGTAVVEYEDGDIEGVRDVGRLLKERGFVVENAVGDGSSLRATWCKRVADARRSTYQGGDDANWPTVDIASELSDNMGEDWDKDCEAAEAAANRCAT